MYRIVPVSLETLIWLLLIGKCDTRIMPLNTQIVYYATTYKEDLMNLVEFTVYAAQMPFLKEECCDDLNKWITGNFSEYSEEELAIFFSITRNLSEKVEFHFAEPEVFRREFSAVLMDHLTYFFDMLLGSCIIKYDKEPDFQIIGLRQQLMQVISIIKKIEADELYLPSTPILFDIVYQKCKAGRYESFQKSRIIHSNSGFVWK
jgi:hypothetical protein